jgi:hypothetical protein
MEQLLHRMRLYGQRTFTPVAWGRLKAKRARGGEVTSVTLQDGHFEMRRST